MLIYIYIYIYICSWMWIFRQDKSSKKKRNQLLTCCLPWLAAAAAADNDVMSRKSITSPVTSSVTLFATRFSFLPQSATLTATVIIIIIIMRSEDYVHGAEGLQKFKRFISAKCMAVNSNGCRLQFTSVPQVAPLVHSITLNAFIIPLTSVVCRLFLLGTA